MRVAIDISPTKSGHKLRGIGAYTKSLIDELKKGWGIEFEFFESADASASADVIHYPYFDLFFHTLPINKKAKRVVTIHDVIPLVFPSYFPVGVKGNINLILQKLALKNVDAVICDSNTSKNDIIQKLSYPSEKIHVVYLAAGENFKKIRDKKRLSKARVKYKLPADFILYVGDLNWNKNILGLLEAIKISGVNLVMVGESAVNESLSQVSEINTKIDKLNIKDKVIRTGFVPEEELIDIYNLADATVMPSFYEGFGLSVLESMACGTPVVCSKAASLSEIGGKVAIFCNPHDPSDIAQKINYIVNLDPAKKIIISKKSTIAANKYSWRKVAKETIEVYKKVANSNA